MRTYVHTLLDLLQQFSLGTRPHKSQTHNFVSTSAEIARPAELVPAPMRHVWGWKPCPNAWWSWFIVPGQGMQACLGWKPCPNVLFHSTRNQKSLCSTKHFPLYPLGSTELSISHTTMPLPSVKQHDLRFLYFYLSIQWINDSRQSSDVICTEKAAVVNY